MTDQLSDRVNELVNEAETTLEGDDESGDLAELAVEADDLLSSEDSGDVLEAVGLGELPDGSEPASIPEAIAKGDSGGVATLRALLALAKLPGAEGEERDEIVDRVREAVDERSSEESTSSGGEESGESSGDETDEADTESSDEDETGESEDSDGEESEGDGTESDADSGSGDGVEDDNDDEDGDADGDEADGEGGGNGLESEVRSALGDAISGVRDEADETRSRLEKMLSDDEAAAEAESEADRADAAEAESTPGGADAAEAANADSSSAEAAAAEAEAAEEEGEGEDDGWFETDDSRSSPNASMYSTMPPSPSERTGMGRVGRFSTMPKRNR